MSSIAEPAVVAGGFNRFTTRLGKAVSWCGFLGTIEDIARPLAPFAGYVCALALAALVVSFPLRRVASAFREELIVARLSAGVLAAISAFLYFAEVRDPKIAERGVLATVIPAIAEVQNSLFSIDKHLSGIENNTQRTVEAIDNLTVSSKKETSADPRKELANLGVKWDLSSFNNAQQMRDVRTMELLLAGGMRPKPGFGGLLLFVDSPSFSEEIAKLYLSFDVFQAPDSCAPVDDYWPRAFYEKVLAYPAKTRFVKEVCGPKIKQALDAKLLDQERRLSEIHSFNAKRSLMVQQCVSELSAKYTPTTLYRSSLGAGDYEAQAASADDLLSIMVRREVYARGYALDQRMAGSYIHRACDQYYAIKPYDAEAYRLGVLKQMRAELVE